MPDIEPFKFQKSTNIEEHNQMKDKINEMVEVINDIDLENLPNQIDALETEVATQGNEIDALEVTVNAIPNTYAKKTDIPDVSDFITDDALTPYAKIVDVNNADISGIDANIANGEITIKLTRPDGDMTDSIDCPFIQTATLIPTSTARAFKIRFTYTDGTQYDTNEFVIPEGGGTDVSVTGVTVGDGTAPNSFKVTIQLSDTTTIGSNDYVIEFPENINTYPTTLTGSLSGTTLTLTIGLNNGSSVQGTVNLGALLTGYATTSYVDTQVATKLDKATADGYYQPKGNYAPAGDYVTEPAVTSVTGEMINGNLVIKVNGVSSGDIPLPKSGLKFINFSRTTLTGVSFAYSNETKIDAWEFYMSTYQASGTVVLPSHSDIVIKADNCDVDSYFGQRNNYKSVYNVQATDWTAFNNYLKNTLSSLPDGEYKIAICKNSNNDVFMEAFTTENSFFNIIKTNGNITTQGVKIIDSNNISTQINDPYITVIGIQSV